MKFFLIARQFKEIKELHEFVKLHTDCGHLSRQEAVSMIPALLLNPKPYHKVLDMCASPGSKTAQLIEAIECEDKTNARPGLVIANDASSKRAYMLVHQTLRVGMDKTAVTCHLGQEFPGLYNESGELQRNQVFDRVLCDVPCSGDGTLRKSPNLWKTWHIGGGLTLHPLQIELAKRAAGLLKIDGLMVYSTCSFNPVENEAVSRLIFLNQRSWCLLYCISI